VGAPTSVRWGGGGRRRGGLQYIYYILKPLFHESGGVWGFFGIQKSKETREARALREDIINCRVTVTYGIQRFLPRLLGYLVGIGRPSQAFPP